jgi:SAM-dependent methyltransferase
MITRDVRRNNKIGLSAQEDIMSGNIAAAKCRICGFSSFVILYNKQESGIEAKVLKCKNCGIVFIHPLSRKNTSIFAYQNKNVFSSNDLKRYQERLKRLESPFAKLILRRFYGYRNISLGKIPFVKKTLAFCLRGLFLRDIIHFRGEGRILDVGCGPALYLALLKSIGWKVYGVEVNTYACEYAVNKLGINVFCGELEKSNFPSDFFDVIRLVHVLEHLPSPLTTFTEIKRILKPDGIIYIETPNQRSFAFKCFKEKWPGIDSHIYAFSTQTLDFLCNKLGLRINKITYRSTKGTVIDSLERLWKEKFGIGCPFSFYKNKLIYNLVIKPFCFFLRFIHWADTFTAEITISDIK